MPGSVYLLCCFTSLMCSLLLWRSYLRSRVGLLFWAALCFLGFAIENAGLFADRIVFPHIDLSVYRLGVGVGSVAVFVYGLVRETA